MRLFSYKMTHDTGFAPNPFFGVLTLATCKPKIREHKQVGDWIAGFTSKALCREEVLGEERLVYLMRVDEKITYKEYWNNLKYDIKKPDSEAGDRRKRVGDNIYIPNDELGVTGYVQLTNKHHDCSNMERDLKSHFVLLSKHFFYFGSNPLSLPIEIRPTVPKVQSADGYSTKDENLARRFISHIEENYPRGIISHPNKWFPNDYSWKSNENNIES